MATHMWKSLPLKGIKYIGSAGIGFIHSFIHPSIHPSLHSSIPPYIHSSIHSFIHPSFHSSIHPFIHSSIYPFIHSSIHPFIRSSVGPFFRLSVRLFVHPFSFMYIHYNLFRNFRTSKCPARATSTLEHFILKTSNTHSHLPFKEKLQAQIIKRNMIKDKCKNSVPNRAIVVDLKVL